MPSAAAPSVRIAAAPMDGVAPEGYHAMSIFPEYFKIGGRWLLAEESRMDCVPVLEGLRSCYVTVHSSFLTFNS